MLLMCVFSRSRRLSLKMLRRQFSWTSSRRPSMYSTDNLAKLTADKLNVSEHQRMNDSGKSVYTCILRVYRNCAVIDFGLFL